VGSGVVQLLKKRARLIKNRFNTCYAVKAVCDLNIKNTRPKGLKKALMTDNYKEVINHDDVDVVVELIGGLHPAKEIVTAALKKGKHVVTANKALISNYGKELFQLAQKHQSRLYYESSVLAGVPIIKTITEGVIGNKFGAVYGIVNGTCNFILDQMTKNNCSFEAALKKAQKEGYAESDPTLDINGMDAAHKLAILIYLAFGKFMRVKDIHTEGVTHISYDDIEYAESMDLTIKLLAIAKKKDGEIEARVHPTFISKDHPLASINGVANAVYLHAEPLGNIMLSGLGAGKMAAASGVVSDLINLAMKGADGPLSCNLYDENPDVNLRKIDEVDTKFYLRFFAVNKPGVLSKIAGVLGQHGIGINSVTQRGSAQAAAVPVILLTEYAQEKKVRLALKKIDKLSIVKDKSVAIRMENL
jgi:homoserine dehydrogenase